MTVIGLIGALRGYECPTCGHIESTTSEYRGYTAVLDHVYCSVCKVESAPTPGGVPQIEICSDCGTEFDMIYTYYFNGCGHQLENLSDRIRRTCLNYNCVDGKLYDFGN